MTDISIHKPHHKFSHDSIDYENDWFKVLTKGIFLGINTPEESRLVNHIITEYTKKGELFVKDLRGSFFIYLVDKHHDKHLVYTNHLGDQRIFYTHVGNRLRVSSSIKDLTGIFKAENLTYSLNTTAVYYLLTYGHMFGEATLINEIKRLKPGHYMRYTSGEPEVLPYYQLSNTPDNKLKESDAIEHLDELFRNSIRLEFEKDLQYGYAHMCSLSGGLDSRMTTWVARELGYENITNFTFSQTGQPDMTIPRQITADLGLEWIFKPLDKGSFMSAFEDVTCLVDATTSYLPISHGKYAIEDLDFESFGILHTGQLGDVTIGSYLTSNHYGKPRFAKARSNRLIHKLPAATLEGYDNLELFLYLNRGLLYILTGNVPIQQFTETSSPFLDIDFLNFCMSVPLRFRLNHRLYKKWILQKYPGAAKYIWERLGSRISVPTISIRKKTMTYSKLPAFVYNGIRLQAGLVKKEKLDGTTGMNPFIHWYDTNNEVSSSINHFFKDNLYRVADPEIRQDCELLFTTGNIHEKAQVVTFLSAIKQFFT